MNVLFRTDASAEIGTGHVMRCLTLASYLRSQGAKISFICRELKSDLCEYIESKGFIVLRIKNKHLNSKPDRQLTNHPHFTEVNWNKDALETKKIIERQKNIDLLIIDHYSIDINWEKHIRPYVKKIMVIDDLANRSHDCDILLDQNLVTDMEKRYTNLISNSCEKLLGPKYALLRSEFLEAKLKMKERKGDLQRILIFFGGDLTNETTKALKASLLLEQKGINIDVVVGKTNPYKSQIQELCESISCVNFYFQIDHMAELMSKADVAIGAGGSTTWERCCLGLPSIVLTLADNQVELTKKVEEIGAHIYLGDQSGVTIYHLYNTLCRLIREGKTLKKMSENGMNLVDGKGALRVINRIIY
ncbi:UDP-2,4-diacetamido-2,4,6-trideoxy-beta-L-altropyranose hydrolase [Cytobacillus firmus]|uniref:UDP-2,4-diacetamido-2,4, 6-trideoxy-beta-L-altropyranose hydrolase n=1 Tax=Cytobacillus firmus TaxID=1399 RepID=UPI0018CD18B2|nr:UDP-2,4-diacetamido-2,4,6-trideoxy-beta-L-altropyranose hydrolase [Cytobacillus firmus]MBG9588626.1 hypothetical protein [Cytobacillus firmus]